jgi:uncharacterized protein
VVQTKTPIYKAPDGDDTFDARLDTALERLRSDYIDVYLYHSCSVDAFEKNGDAAWKTVSKAKEDGRVRHLGLSTHDTPENVKKLIDTGVFESILMQYNLIDRKYAECFAYAKSKGMGTAVMGPVGGGRLVAPSDVAQLVPGSSSAVQACFRFVWSNPNIDVALSGMTTPEQLDENLVIADTSQDLTPDERAALAGEIDKRQALLDLYCTGCNYCMPCPNDVNIPGCFLAMNWLKVYNLEEPARKSYASLMDKEADASRCVECGECEDKCPQAIQIIEQLQHVHKALG